MSKKNPPDPPAEGKLSDEAIAKIRDGSPALKAFKEEVRALLDAAGVATLEEWAKERPGEHLSATYGSYPSCALCGKVEPHTGYRSQCKGVVKVVLRGQREHGKTIRMLHEACNLARESDHTHVHLFPKGLPFERVLSMIGSMRREGVITLDDEVVFGLSGSVIRFGGGGSLRLKWGK